MEQAFIERKSVTSPCHGSTISGWQQNQYNDDGDGKENGKK